MIKRCHTSLFEPRNLASFTKDHLLRVFFYIVIIAMISSLGTIITLSQYNRISAAEVSNIKKTIMENTALIPDIKIVNYELEESLEKNTFIYDGMNISINEEPPFSMNFSAAFIKDGVLVMGMGRQVFFYTYQDLKIENLDFALLKDGDILETTKLVSGINQFLLMSKVVWAPSTLVVAYFAHLFYHLVIALTMALIFKLWHKLSYLVILRLTVYGLTASQISILLDELFGTSFIYLFGGIISVVFINLALEEVYKRSLTR